MIHGIQCRQGADRLKGQTGQILLKVGIVLALPRGEKELIKTHTFFHDRLRANRKKMLKLIMLYLDSSRMFSLTIYMYLGVWSNG